MLICLKCKQTFMDPATIYDDIGYKYSACPYCEDDRIEESEPCKQCSDPKPEDYEDYCDTCKEAMREKVVGFIEDMRSEMWDRTLILDTMQEVLEGEE
jgi:DNA-directed RNA polymerase subunit RPC12/RpoP